VAGDSIVCAFAEEARRRHSTPPASVTETVDAASAALFLAYADQSLPDRGFGKAALQCWDHAVEGIARHHFHPFLMGGFVGVAWVGQHLRTVLAMEDPDPDADVDETLLSTLGRQPGRFDFDLVSGLVGMGVYGLERLPHPTAHRLVEAVIRLLAERALTDRGGLTWPSPEGLRAPYEQGGPYGELNLGLAHGAPGVLAFLASAWSAGFQGADVRGMIDSAVNWIWAHRIADDPSSWFPAKRGVGTEIHVARTAWCYGDPGIAMALLLAGQALGSQEYLDRATSVAEAVAARPEALTRVQSASLCHGALGISHILHRFWEAMGNTRFASAARLWQLRADRFLRAGANDLEDTSLLEGISGMGLVLTWSIKPEVKPQWDRLLLMSLRGVP
jgi:lantibiotic modifying enzyme